VAAGTHPDYYAVRRPDDALEFPIKIVRELIANLGLKPARGHGKIAILDDADDLNDESANCFFKTLEEPPPRSLLILIGTSSERQLSTIVSRCQVIRFAPLAPNLIADLLREQGQEDPELIERLVRLSGGSLGQAVALAEPALWEFRRTLVAGLTAAQPDTVGLAQQWARFVEEAGKDSSLQRRRAALVVRLLIDFFSNALALSVGGTPRAAEASDLPALQELVKRCGPERLLSLLERCLEGDHQIDRRVQLVLILEALLDALGRTSAANREAAMR
jgi:DNA polymerase-3 subunit delta'